MSRVWAYLGPFLGINSDAQWISMGNKEHLFLFTLFWGGVHIGVPSWKIDGPGR